MANTTTTKSDAVLRRLYARGRWKIESVAHFGGDDTGVADMCLLKDADGNPFIPGASIAGAARSFLARMSQPWADYKDRKEGKSLKRFFGGDMRQNRSQLEKNKDTMSALIVADASCVSEQVVTSVRDGVRIAHASGVAADKAKFDVEVLERGTEFQLSLECVIREGDAEPEFKKLFLALLHGFQEGDIRLGALTRRGYGRGKVASWEIRDLHMGKPGDVMAWLRDDFWNGSEGKCTLTPYQLTDQRRYFQIEADFKLRTSLLIRSSSEDPEAPDMTHLHSNDRPVVPGTSFAGAFRHRATVIASTIGWYEEAVSEMFGPVHEQQNMGQQTELWASRVWIEEQLIKNVKTQWQDRVAIDRFTGGSLDSALFNEKPVYPLSLEEATEPNLRLRLTLEEPEEAEIGLLFLTLRDFWHGHAALGGETSGGRGTLCGIEARLQYKDSDASDAKVWKFSHINDHMTLSEGDNGLLKSYAEKVQGYSGSPTASRRPKKKEETTNV